MGNAASGTVNRDESGRSTADPYDKDNPGPYTTFPYGNQNRLATGSVLYAHMELTNRVVQDIDARLKAIEEKLKGPYDVQVANAGTKNKLNYY